MRLKDKVAIITGGGGDIGRETCKLFAREGAKIMIADLIIGKANKIADELKAQGHQAEAMKIDVTSFDEANRLAGATLDKFGQIDILANIAGGAAGPVIKTKPHLLHLTLASSEKISTSAPQLGHLSNDTCRFREF